MGMKTKRLLFRKPSPSGACAVHGLADFTNELDLVEMLVILEISGYDVAITDAPILQPGCAHTHTGSGLPN